MTVLYPVVGPAADLLLGCVAQYLHCGLGCEAVGGDLFRRSVALECLLHERQRGVLVALLRHEAFEDLAFLVDCAPQVDHLAIELHVHLIKVPAPLEEVAHARDALPADVACEQRTKPVPPCRTLSWQMSNPRS